MVKPFYCGVIMDIEDCITQYEEVFDGAPWYGSSFLKSIQEVPVSFWNQKPAGASHSIAELKRI